MTAPAPAFATRDLGPAVEREVAGDLIRRSVFVLPVLVALCALGWGIDGALSSAYACALVLANFALAAAILSSTARISFALLMAAALGGYVFRLGAISAAVLVVKDMAWVSLWPLCLTLLVAHIGLLAWETRFVAASLAFPGLKPRKDS